MGFRCHSPRVIKMCVEVNEGVLSLRVSFRPRTLFVLFALIRSKAMMIAAKNGFIIYLALETSRISFCFLYMRYLLSP